MADNRLFFFDNELLQDRLSSQHKRYFVFENARPDWKVEVYYDEYDEYPTWEALLIYRGKCVASGANADDAAWALDALRKNVQGCWNFITEMGF